MFYRVAEGHGLKHDPFSAIVSPRPIAWVSSVDIDGSRNLAPYSFFTAVAYTPPQIIVSSVGSKADRAKGKDSFSNISATGVFAVNLSGRDDAERLNASSAAYPADTDEAALAGIATSPCIEIEGFRITDAPASLECRLNRIIELDGENNYLMIAQVVAVHLRDEYVTPDGIFDVTRYRPLARLGYLDFGSIDSVFPLERPKI